MIKKQFEKVGKKIAEQSHKLLGTKKGSKKIMIEAYITKIGYAFPEIQREDIAIIVTGFIAELRTMDDDTRRTFLRDH